MDSFGAQKNNGFIARVTAGKRWSLLLKVLVAFLAIWAISWLFPVGSISDYNLPYISPKPTGLPNSDTNFVSGTQPHEKAPAPTAPIPSAPHEPSTPSAHKDDHHTLGVQPDTRNVAAIIETRPLMNLAPLVLHFSSVLGSHWPIHIFTNTTEHLKSASFQRAVDLKQVVIHILPSNITFDNRDAVSEFLTEPWFYEQLTPAGHVLLFQSDSILCANAPLHVDNFLKYDFVGAPIAPEFETAAGYNGGLSLRNRERMLKVISKNDWKSEQAAAADPENKDVRYEMRYEDQWFYQKMIDTAPNADGSPWARLPSREEAKKFSVETYWYEKPIGYHQLGRWAVWTDHPERKAEALKYCPEWELATKEEIKDV